MTDPTPGNNTSTATVNVLALPRLTLVKNVLNDDGGTAVATAWTLTATGSAQTVSGTSGSAAVTNVAVPVGTYALSEAGGPAGYTAGTYSCVVNDGAAIVSDSIALAGGDVATCTITNDDQAATLTLVKTVINDNGGTATASDFPLTATGPTTITGISGTAAVTNAPVNAGVYTLSEPVVAGYTAGAWSCTAGTLSGNQLTLANGNSATCSIVNDDQAATLTLVKTVSGGPAVATNWTLSAAGPTPVSGPGGVSAAPVGAGVYTLSEAGGVSNVTYTASAWSCTGGALSGDQLTLANGESATCSITNTYVAPAVTFTKTANTTGPVVVGDTITYTLTTVVANSQTTSVTTLTDRLGTGLTFGSVTNAGAYTANTAGAPVLTFTLPAGTVPGTYTVSYTATVNADAFGMVRNSASCLRGPVGGSGGDPSNPGGPSGSSPCGNGFTEIPVTAPAVTYSKSASPTGPVAVGETITYTLTTVVANSQTTSVTTLTDTLGTGLDFVAVTNAGAYTCNSTNPLVCTLPVGTVPGTYTVTYTATVNAQAVGTVDNAVVGTNATCTTNCGTSTPVTAPAVTYSKSASPTGPVAVGETITYTLTTVVANSQTTSVT
ncbi:isopeptide-forming domain-containing fimbrial protein, partial [Pseudoxanthomonas sp. PXM03]|uniref:isopeptide-forming domain-containing fimbrial protein n=1 Tax=Pseudoxanthomonas sp. PXM03 TaxID=2769284 RepID=UPI0017819147|nr:isopeptide-forming domain-containing fimbrial protein [Pseudoxanthomonas sp. PXM03]